MSAAVVFAPIRAALEAAGLPYALGGSWASAAYGEPRMTRDIDVVVDFTPEKLARFVAALPREYYLDREEAQAALRLGRPFNAIFVPQAFKIDFFPARAFPLGLQEIERAVPIAGTEISADPVPFVSPEDILLAKLHWYELGGGVSEIQWRDICGVVSARRGKLDVGYLRSGAATLGVTALLKRALSE